jgi:transcriptional regulator with XRE-family HTH domain
MPEKGWAMGQTLRTLRKAHGLSQQELATKAGCAQGLISMIENGLTPSDATLAKLAGAFGIQADNLRTLK